jgi:hypothetical protein
MTLIGVAPQPVAVMDVGRRMGREDVEERPVPARPPRAGS